MEFPSKEPLNKNRCSKGVHPERGEPLFQRSSRRTYGVAKVVEIVWQLRGEAGERQINNPRVGIAQIMGGYKEWDTRACTVHILVKN